LPQQKYKTYQNQRNNLNLNQKIDWLNS
jgi:hypothetical protein